MNVRQPSSRLTIEVVDARGDVIARTLADRYRADVARAGHGDGYCGFAVACSRLEAAGVPRFFCAEPRAELKSAPPADPAAGEEARAVGPAAASGRRAGGPPRHGMDRASRSSHRAAAASSSRRRSTGRATESDAVPARQPGGGRLTASTASCCPCRPTCALCSWRMSPPVSLSGFADRGPADHPDRRSPGQWLARPERPVSRRRRSALCRRPRCASSRRRRHDPPGPGIRPC